MRDIIRREVGLAFEVVKVVRVEFVLEIPFLRERRFSLKRLDQVVTFCKVFALRPLARDTSKTTDCAGPSFGMIW